MNCTENIQIFKDIYTIRLNRISVQKYRKNMNKTKQNKTVKKKRTKKYKMQHIKVIARIIYSIHMTRFKGES